MSKQGWEVLTGPTPLDKVGTQAHVCWMELDPSAVPEIRKGKEEKERMRAMVKCSVTMPGRWARFLTRGDSVGQVGRKE